MEGEAPWAQEFINSLPVFFYLCSLSSTFLRPQTQSLLWWRWVRVPNGVRTERIKKKLCPSPHGATTPPNWGENFSPWNICHLFCPDSTASRLPGSWGVREYRKRRERKNTGRLSDFLWALEVLFRATQVRARLLEFSLICAIVIFSRFQAAFSPAWRIMEGKRINSLPVQWYF